MNGNADRVDVIVRRSRPDGECARVYGPLAVDGRISDGALRTLLVADLLCGGSLRAEFNTGLITELRGMPAGTIRGHWSELVAVGLISVDPGAGGADVITLNDQRDVYGETITTLPCDFSVALRPATDAVREGWEPPTGVPEASAEGNPKGI